LWIQYSPLMLRKVSVAGGIAVASMLVALFVSRIPLASTFEWKMHNGTLDKFVGEMIMALFNAPLEDPDHADHAVEMALAMLKGLSELNAKWAKEGKAGFDIGRRNQHR